MLCVLVCDRSPLVVRMFMAMCFTLFGELSNDEAILIDCACARIRVCVCAAYLLIFVVHM